MLNLNQLTSHFIQRFFTRVTYIELDKLPTYITKEILQCKYSEVVYKNNKRFYKIHSGLIVCVATSLKLREMVLITVYPENEGGNQYV